MKPSGWVLSVLCLFLLAASPAVGEDVLRIYKAGEAPVSVATKANQGAMTQAAPLSSHGALDKGILLATLWFVPRYLVDTTAFADTTLWSVRNEESSSINLRVEYFNQSSVLLRADDFVLAPRELKAVNVRDIAELVPNFFGLAAGYITLLVDGQASVDTFQIDVSENRATGQKAVSLFELCETWQSRFIVFGPGDASTLHFLFNGPLGGDPDTDPPTVTGTVYNEAGVELGAFTLHTSAYVTSVDSELLSFGLGAGVIEMVIDTAFEPQGYVSVEHQAGGRFSAGLGAFCLDPP